MYKLLSERMNPSPPPNVLIMDDVSDKLCNQVIFVIRAHLSRCDCINLPRLYYSAIDNYDYYAGNDPDRKCDEDTMYDMLRGMYSTDFLDFLDVICNTLLSDPFFSGCFGEQFIHDINDVMISNSMGYIIAGDQLIPNTDIKEAEEIIIPAFHTLSSLGMNSSFEYLELSYEHYKNRNNPEAILSAFKALESTVEFLLKRLSVDHSAEDRIVKKIKLLIENLGIQTYLMEDFNKLIDLMKCPGEIRNKLSGHGNADIINVPDYFVKYEIDLVASNILFLVRCYQERNSG